MLRVDIVVSILRLLHEKIEREEWHIDAADFQEKSIGAILDDAGIHSPLTQEELCLLDLELRKLAERCQTAEISRIYADIEPFDSDFVTGSYIGMNQL